jgi:copper chaperone CopZ
MTNPVEHRGSTVSLTVDGMSCDHCVARVRKAIDGLVGVTSSSVRIGGAQVAFDPSSISEDEIASAVTRAGYPAAAVAAAK